MYKLKRETKIGIETVMSGNRDECLDWIQEIIERNRYEYQLTVNLNMDPVWIMKDRVFWLVEV